MSREDVIKEWLVSRVHYMYFETRPCQIGTMLGVVLSARIKLSCSETLVYLGM
jgi:hypothetical protein